MLRLLTNFIDRGQREGAVVRSKRDRQLKGQNSALFAQVRDVEIGSEFGGAFHAEIDAPGRWFWKDQLAELCAFFKEPIAKGAGRSQVVATQIEEIPYVMVAQAALMLQFLCFTHAFIIA